MSFSFNVSAVSQFPEIQASSLSQGDLFYVSQKVSGEEYGSRKISFGQLSGAIGGGNIVFGGDFKEALYSNIPNSGNQVTANGKYDVPAGGGSVLGTFDLSSVIGCVIQNSTIEYIHYVPTYTNKSGGPQVLVMWIAGDKINNNTASNIDNNLQMCAVRIDRNYVSDTKRGAVMLGYQTNSHEMSFFNYDRSKDGVTHWYFFPVENPTFFDFVYGTGVPFVVDPNETVAFVQMVSVKHRNNSYLDALVGNPTQGWATITESQFSWDSNIQMTIPDGSYSGRRPIETNPGTNRVNMVGSVYRQS